MNEPAVTCEARSRFGQHGTADDANLRRQITLNNVSCRSGPCITCSMSARSRPGPRRRRSGTRSFS